MARRLRVEPYDANAVDGDGDGIVQENTAWERPVGTRLIDEFGEEIRAGLMSMQRPSRMRVVDRNGNDVPYTPSYASAVERQVSRTALGSIGAPSLAESDITPVPTLADRGLRTIGETMSDVDAIVNPQTITPPDVDELPLPTPKMYPTMEKSSSDVDILDAYSPAHSGLPMFDTLLGIGEGYDTLKDEWDSSNGDYFSYETGVDLTFDEFVELVRLRADGKPLPRLVRDDGKVINDDPDLLDRFGVRIDETLTHVIERNFRSREILKDHVSTQVGSKMADMPVSKDTLDYFVGRLARRGTGTGLFSKIEEGESASFNFPDFGAFGFGTATSFDEGTLPSPSQLKEYVAWGLGGERPLWIDSPDLDPDVRQIFSLPPVIRHPEGVPSTKEPTFTIGAFMPITEFDSPEVVAQKEAVARLLQRYGSAKGDGVYSVQHFAQIKFQTYFTGYSRQTRTDASFEIAEDVMQSVFEHLSETRNQPGEFWSDTSFGRAVGELLDSRMKPTEEISLENRLMFFAASDLCDDQTRSILIERLGWDFTKQERWPELVEAVKLRGPLKNHEYDFPELRIIDRDTMADFVKRDGSLVTGFREFPDFGETDYELRLSRDIAQLISTAESVVARNTDASNRDEKTAALEALKAFLAFEPRPGPKSTMAEKDGWVRELYQLYSQTIPGHNDRTPLETALGLLYRNSNTDPLSPEKAGLLSEQPTLDFYRYIASRYVSQWAESSNGASPLSYLIQDSVQSIFGLNDDDVVGFDDIFKTTPHGPERESILRELEKLRSGESEMVRNFILAQYENTQEFYRSRGITSVPVARGMNLPEDHPYVQELLSMTELWRQDLGDGALVPPSIEASVLHRPLSSFATYLPATKNFAGNTSTTQPIPDGAGNFGVVILSQVPVHQIFGNPYTGNGCLNEYELVVIGGGINGRVHLTADLTSVNAFDARDSLAWRTALARLNAGRTEKPSESRFSRLLGRRRR